MLIQAIRPFFRSHRSPVLLSTTSFRLGRQTSLIYTRQQSGMATTAESLNKEIAEQTALFNDLRKQQADPAALDEVKKRLGELKRSLASIPGVKDADKKRERLLLKTAKVRHYYIILIRCFE